MRAALVQLSSGDDPAANLTVTEMLVREAAAGGATFVLTPECVNIISADRARQRAVLRPEAEDPTLARLAGTAADLRIWLLLGSLCVRTEDPDGRFANRALLLGPDGRVHARYDKIHMFDVSLAGGETYRESSAYRPGARAVVADIEDLRLGLSICYDLRFPTLYRTLAKAGATALAIPSAFTVPTGEAHWHTLVRARAIENGAFVLAPAQTGIHAAITGTPRRTYGHSLAVGPWGDLLLDMGTEPGVGFVDLDTSAVVKARAAVPSLTHDRPFQM